MTNVIWIWRVIVCFLCKYIPKKKNRIVFGAWFSQRFSDNSKYLFTYMYETYGDKFEYVWILKDPSIFPEEYENVTVLKRGSFKAWFYCVTSKISVMTHGYKDFSEYNLVRGSYMVMLWHGIAWKKIAYDTRDINRNGIRHKLIKRVEQCDLYIAPSDVYKSSLLTAFDLNEDKILLVGQPRNVLFYSEDSLAEARKALCNIVLKKYEVDMSEGVIITYMPTFRDQVKKQNEFLLAEDIEKIEKETGKEVFIINKNHFIDTGYCHNDYHIFQVDDIDTQLLLGASDILISDYSSCIFDFLVLNRPIIQYVYDYDFYKNKDRGLYYDIEQVTCGDTPKSKEELSHCLAKNIKDNMCNKKQRKEVFEFISSFESKDSCAIISTCVFKNIGIS